MIYKVINKSEETYALNYLKKKLYNLKLDIEKGITADDKTNCKKVDKYLAIKKVLELYGISEEDYGGKKNVCKNNH